VVFYVLFVISPSYSNCHQVGEILSGQSQFGGRLFDIPSGTTTGVGRDYREDGVTPYDYLKVSDSWMVSALGANSW
jgi:hypothetical protein